MIVSAALAATVNVTESPLLTTTDWGCDVIVATALVDGGDAGGAPGGVMGGVLGGVLGGVVAVALGPAAGVEAPPPPPQAPISADTTPIAIR